MSNNENDDNSKDIVNHDKELEPKTLLTQVTDLDDEDLDERAGLFLHSRAEASGTKTPGERQQPQPFFQPKMVFGDMLQVQSMVGRQELEESSADHEKKSEGTEHRPSRPSENDKSTLPSDSPDKLTPTTTAAAAAATEPNNAPVQPLSKSTQKAATATTATDPDTTKSTHKTNETTANSTAFNSTNNSKPHSLSGRSKGESGNSNSSSNASLQDQATKESGKSKSTNLDESTAETIVPDRADSESIKSFGQKQSQSQLQNSVDNANSSDNNNNNNQSGFEKTQPKYNENISLPTPTHSSKVSTNESQQPQNVDIPKPPVMPKQKRHTPRSVSSPRLPNYFSKTSTKPTEPNTNTNDTNDNATNNATHSTNAINPNKLQPRPKSTLDSQPPPEYDPNQLVKPRSKSRLKALSNDRPRSVADYSSTTDTTADGLRLDKRTLAGRLRNKENDGRSSSRGSRRSIMANRVSGFEGDEENEDFIIRRSYHSIRKDPALESIGGDLQSNLSSTFSGSGVGSTNPGRVGTGDEFDGQSTTSYLDFAAGRGSQPSCSHPQSPRRESVSSGANNNVNINTSNVGGFSDFDPQYHQGSRIRKPSSGRYHHQLQPPLQQLASSGWRRKSGRAGQPMLPQKDPSIRVPSSAEEDEDEFMDNTELRPRRPKPRVQGNAAYSKNRRQPPHVSQDADLSDGSDDRQPLLFPQRRYTDSRRRKQANIIRQIFYAAFIAVFMLCFTLVLMLVYHFTSMPLKNVEATRLSDILATDKELIFNLRVRSTNRNIRDIVVENVSLRVFAASVNGNVTAPQPPQPPTKGNDTTTDPVVIGFEDNTDNNNNQRNKTEPAVEVGAINSLTDPLRFRMGSLASDTTSSEMTEIKIDETNSNVTGTKQWHDIITDVYDVTVRGTLKYTLWQHKYDNWVCVHQRVDPATGKVEVNGEDGEDPALPARGMGCEDKVDGSGVDELEFELVPISQSLF